MEAYTSFAAVYDRFMDNVPYEEWVGYVLDVLENHGISDGLVLDLGCGTGAATRLLARHGYDMIGVDSSEDMLMIANEKLLAESESAEDIAEDACEEDACEEDAYEEVYHAATKCTHEKNSRLTEGDLCGGEDENSQAEGNLCTSEKESSRSEDDLCSFEGENGRETDILYLCQDMREFELYGTVRAIVSMCDCINYILESDELLTVFKLAHNYLDWDGLFIFDMNTPYKYEEMLSDNTFAENREDCSFIWENDYDPETKINTYDLTLFVRNETGDFTRYEEYHEQRCYEPDEVCELLRQAGFAIEKVCEAYSGDELGEESDRALFVARKQALC